MPRTSSTRMAALMALAILLLAACGGPAQPTPATTPAPGAPTQPAPPGSTPAAATPPSATAQPAGDVEVLGPSADLSGTGMHTLGQTAVVENISTLTLLQAERGDALSSLPPPEGQTAYSFLVEFHWDGATPGPIEIGSGYYNAINFSLRDDEEFEHPVMQSVTIASRPELLFGDLAAGQRVRGWVTLFGPEDSEYVELVYRPVASDPVFFRVEPSG